MTEETVRETVEDIVQMFFGCIDNNGVIDFNLWDDLKKEAESLIWNRIINDNTKEHKD